MGAAAAIKAVTAAAAASEGRKVRKSSERAQRKTERDVERRQQIESAALMERKSEEANRRLVRSRGGRTSLIQGGATGPQGSPRSSTLGGGGAV